MPCACPVVGQNFVRVTKLSECPTATRDDCVADSLSNQGETATVSYSLLRFPMATGLTEAEIDELEPFAHHAHGSEAPECFPECGRIGLIDLDDAQLIALRMVEFCRAGIQHWKNGAIVSRFQPAQREKKA